MKKTKNVLYFSALVVVSVLFFFYFESQNISTAIEENISQVETFPREIVSLQISEVNFNKEIKKKNKFVGHIGGNIFYIHQSLVQPISEEILFAQIYEKNNHGARKVEEEKEFNEQGEIIGLTPAHYVDRDGRYIHGYHNDPDIFIESGLSDLVKAEKIGKYYVVKTKKSYNNPIFTFCYYQLAMYFPSSSPKKENVKDFIVLNQMGGMLFYVD